MIKKAPRSLWVWILCLMGGLFHQASAHPLRLSLSEIDYASQGKTLTINLRLFLTDVNEALLFDPDNNELALGQPNEVARAEGMLLEYLNQFFYIKVNGQRLALNIVSKSLSGEGVNTALNVLFEYPIEPPLKTLEVKNAVFTDLFFNQSNIVYVYNDDASSSFMLNKETPVHVMEF